MPSIAVWVIIQDLDTLESREFKQNWGGFYEEIQTKNKPQVFYHFAFMIRRLCFLMICF
jgi:hypothetical protein